MGIRSCRCPSSSKARVVMIVALHSHAPGSSGGRPGSRHSSYSPAIASTPPGPRPDGVRRLTSPLELLTDELRATPAHLPVDRRPLAYQLAQPRTSTVILCPLPE